MTGHALNNTSHTSTEKVMSDLQDENIRLSQQMHELEQRFSIVSAQLKQLALSNKVQLAGRVRIGVALDNPNALSETLDTLLDNFEEEKDNLTNEALELRRSNDVISKNLEAALARNDRLSAALNEVNDRSGNDRDTLAAEALKRELLTQALTERQGTIDALSVELRSAESERAVLQASLREVTARSEALEEQSRSASERISSLISERDEAREWGVLREAEFLSSSSWKVTAPLRALSGIWRKSD